MSGRKKFNVAAEHGIPASILSTIIKGKDTIVCAAFPGNASKEENLKTVPHEKLDDFLLMWCIDTCTKNIPLTREVVQQKGRSLPAFLGTGCSRRAQVGFCTLKSNSGS